MKILLYTFFCFYCADCVSSECSKMSSPEILTGNSARINTLNWKLGRSESCQWILQAPDYTDVLLRVELINLKEFVRGECKTHLVMPDGEKACYDAKGRCYQYTKSAIPASCIDEISGSICEAGTLTNQQINAPNITYNQDSGGLSRGFRLEYEFIDCAATETTSPTTTESSPLSTEAITTTTMKATTTKTPTQSTKAPSPETAKSISTASANSATNESNATNVTETGHGNTSGKAKGTNAPPAAQSMEMVTYIVIAAVGVMLLLAVIICIVVMSKRRKAISHKPTNTAGEKPANSPTPPPVDHEYDTPEEIKITKPQTQAHENATLSIDNGDTSYDTLHAGKANQAPNYASIVMKKGSTERQVHNDHGDVDKNYDSLHAGKAYQAPNYDSIDMTNDSTKRQVHNADDGDVDKNYDNLNAGKAYQAPNYDSIDLTKGSTKPTVQDDIDGNYDTLRAGPAISVPTYDALDVKGAKSNLSSGGNINQSQLSIASMDQSRSRAVSNTSDIFTSEYGVVNEGGTIRLPSRERGSITLLDPATSKESEYADMRVSAENSDEEDDFTSEEEDEKDPPPLYAVINK